MAAFARVTGGGWRVGDDASAQARAGSDGWYFVSAAGSGAHSLTGSLSAQSATVAGAASHLTLHSASGTVSAQAASVAGAATRVTVHTATGALEAQAATIAGVADHTTPGAFSADGTLSAQAASMAGTAQRLALHTASGALEAGSATVDGTAVVPVTHTATGALAAGSASIGGAAQNGEIVATQQPAGRPSKDRRRRRRVVEVDGRIYSVNSDDEAQQLLDTVRQQAEEKAEQAVKRAAQAAKRPARKVIADARKALVVPKIAAPGLEDYAERVVSEIAEAYASAMRSVEIAALLRKREQELEVDDEDVLMLIV